MTRHCLIIGHHAISGQLKEQYESLGCAVRFGDSVADAGAIPEEVFLLADAGGSPADADAHILKELERVAAQASPGTRPVVHMMLRDPLTLRVLLSEGLPKTVEDALEVYPFTQEDEWAKRVLIRLPGIRSDAYPALDRQPVGPDSRQRVHLVVIGFDAYAQALAIHASLIAHYPNYRPEDEMPVRSRITVIDRAIRKRKEAFLADYRALFDNSYWRAVDREKGVEQFHYPIYHGKRLEFTDVEWEFVNAGPEEALVRSRLEEWASDPGRQLTIAVSTGDDNQNLRYSMNLPVCVRDRRVPVLVRQRNAALADRLAQSVKFGAILPFGMEDMAPDVALPLYELAKMVHYFYTCSAGGGGLPTVFPREAVEQAWKSACTFKMRHSNICNVMHMTTKLHSLGHDAADLRSFYSLSEQEVETLARTEHYRWCLDRLVSGTRPCTDPERDAIRRNLEDIASSRRAGREVPEDLKRKYKEEKDAHYDLCAFEELGMDAGGRDVKLYDYDLTACIPLIVKQFSDRFHG